MRVPLFQISLVEDSTNPIAGRLHAFGGSGGPTGHPDETNWILPADVSSIDCSVFNSQGTLIGSPTVVVGDVILDEPQTLGWRQDVYGYNFLHLLAPALVPKGNEAVRIEYKFTLADETVFHAVAVGQSLRLQRS